MLWRDVGYLCEEIVTLNKFRNPVKTFKRREVFCNKKSVRQSEFYQAQSTDYKPELMFEIRSCEYGGESYFEYDYKTYRIIRTYDKNGEIIELVCTSQVIDDE